jgi:hypothetical protein
MSVVTQLCFKTVEENNYMFRPFSVWAIITLRLEYRRKLVYYNVDIKNGGTRSRFTMFGEVCSSRIRDVESAMVTTLFVVSSVGLSVVLRRTFIHLISASTESHNGDDATKVNTTFRPQNMREKNTCENYV